MLPCYSATNMLHAIQMKYKKKDYTVIPGNWKASVTRPEHFQNPIIKSGGKYAKSISLSHILEMTAQSPDLVQFL